jgi:hypothetical protein
MSVFHSSIGGFTTFRALLVFSKICFTAAGGRKPLFWFFILLACHIIDARVIGTACGIEI